MLIPLLIFAATYVVLAIGRLPGFRVDRTGAAVAYLVEQLRSQPLAQSEK